MVVDGAALLFAWLGFWSIFFCIYDVAKTMPKTSIWKDLTPSSTTNKIKISNFTSVIYSIHIFLLLRSSLLFDALNISFFCFLFLWVPLQSDSVTLLYIFCFCFIIGYIFFLSTKQHKIKNNQKTLINWMEQNEEYKKYAVECIQMYIGTFCILATV